MCEKLSSVYLNVLMLTSFTCIWFSVTMSTTSEIISLVVLFLDSYTVFDSVVRIYWIRVISNNYFEALPSDEHKLSHLLQKMNFSLIISFDSLHWKIPSMESPHISPMNTVVFI